MVWIYLPMSGCKNAGNNKSWEFQETELGGLIYIIIGKISVLKHKYKLPKFSLLVIFGTCG